MDHCPGLENRRDGLLPCTREQNGWITPLWYETEVTESLLPANCVYVPVMQR